MLKKFAAPVAAALALAGAVAAGPAAHAEPVAPTVVSITWDDGYSVTSVGLDLMKARGLKGTLYVNSLRTGEPNFFTRAQLKSYYDAGFEIGSHTLNHEDLAALPIDDAKANLCADRTNLMAMGFPVTSLAYPFSSTSPAVEQAAKECGFNSARLTYGLKTPVSCSSCDPAESIPPADPYAIRAPGSVQASYTLDQLKSMVTQAETGGGGWVPLVFHHICDQCTANSITLTDFTAFVDWLAARPATTTVKTVNEVIGGPVQPSPGVADPTPEYDTVAVGSRQRTINGVNITRTKDSLILYTPAKGATTGTNQYGYEAAVFNGAVTQVGTAGNMPIPAGGYVLSGHGTSATWLKSYIKVGTVVAFYDATTPPPPPAPVAHPKATVTIGANTAPVTGVDKPRTTDSLIVYTPDYGASTGTNMYGAEVLVVGGIIAKIENGVGNMAIPDNGYVLSGHGAARKWLLANASVGAAVIPDRQQ
jgi:peptidoglycan/xylan/chitin deacetylase (PgdA/CDA1 family)